MPCTKARQDRTDAAGGGAPGAPIDATARHRRRPTPQFPRGPGPRPHQPSLQQKPCRAQDRPTPRPPPKPRTLTLFTRPPHPAHAPPLPVHKTHTRRKSKKTGARLDEATSTVCVSPPRPFRNLTPSLPRSRRPPASALRRPTYSSAWISLATRASLPSPVSPFSAASNSLARTTAKQKTCQEKGCGMNPEV